MSLWSFWLKGPWRVSMRGWERLVIHGSNQNLMDVPSPTIHLVSLVQIDHPTRIFFQMKESDFLWCGKVNGWRVVSDIYLTETRAFQGGLWVSVKNLQARPEISERFWNLVSQIWIPPWFLNLVIVAQLTEWNFPFLSSGAPDEISD